MLANRALESISHFDKTTNELISKVVAQIKNHDVKMLSSYIVRDLHRISEYGESIAQVAIISFLFHKDRKSVV